MTAEIGVMNRVGVALAADSAVTTSSGRPGQSKIYGSAEKLFQLSAAEPMGIMVYGNGHFVGLPWETIVKTYRHHLGDIQFDTVAEYNDHFIEFLETSNSLFSLPRQDVHVKKLIASLYFDIRDDIHRRLDREAEQHDGLDDADIPPLVLAEVDNRLQSIKDKNVIDGFSANFIRKIRDRYRDDIHAIRNQIFGNLPRTSVANRKIFNVAIEMLSREYFGPSQSGFVVAGFGRNQYMPSLVSTVVDEMVVNRIRFRKEPINEIDDNNSALITPFAQQDVVHSFMQGIDGSLKTEFYRSTHKLLYGLSDALADAIAEKNPELADILRRVIAQNNDELFESYVRDCEDAIVSYWMPIVEITATLPKDELAAMAEALVNLTKFRRRITPEMETVGGPIDVAVITKGDGFIWIKRKHYFKPELNQRKLARLYNEVH